MNDNKKTRLYMLISGLIFGLTVVIEEIGLLSFVSLTPAIYLFLKRTESENYTAKKAYLDGQFFFFGYSFVCFSWFLVMSKVMIPVLGTFGAIAVSLAGAFGLSYLETLLGALVFLTAYFLNKTELIKKRKYLLPIAISMLFALFEYTKTLLFFLVPLVNIGMSLTCIPALLGITSLFGTYFLSAVIVSVNSFLAFALFYKEKIKKYIIISVSVLLTFSTVSVILYFIPHESDGEINVLLLQENVSSAEKWNDPTAGYTFNIQMNLISEHKDNDIDLIVTSETSFPDYLKSRDKYKNGYSDMAKSKECDILVGTFSLNENGDSTNALLPVYKDGNVDYVGYSKKQLVPFGEYLPFGNLLRSIAPFLEDINLFDEDIARGKEISTLKLSGEKKVGTIICFDSIYGTPTLDAVKDGAQFFILSTNDSWFGSSNALYLHERQSRLRAVECGRCLGISGNTGVSEIVNDKGEIEKSLPINESASLFGAMKLYSYRTLYSYIGDLFVYLSALLILSVFVYEIICKLKEKRKRENI